MHTAGGLLAQQAGVRRVVVPARALAAAEDQCICRSLAARGAVRGNQHAVAGAHGATVKG
ncbi:hypothetical protein D3C75_1131620 [compost metagenome]